MPSLIGNKPNQVPSNGDLGSMAFREQDQFLALAGAQTVTGAKTFSEIITASKGVAFPATQVVSADVNTLDDYEEGTWTPTYEPAAGAFTTITYDPLRFGRYTKIGNKVYIECVIRTDAITVGTASGGIAIGGLPFTTINANPVPSFSVGFSSAFGGDMPDAGLGVANATYFSLIYRTTANGAGATLDVTDLGTGANANLVYVSGFYTV
jgi:hypothetical protein